MSEYLKVRDLHGGMAFRFRGVDYVAIVVLVAEDNTCVHVVATAGGEDAKVDIKETGAVVLQLYRMQEVLVTAKDLYPKPTVIESTEEEIKQLVGSQKVEQISPSDRIVESVCRCELAKGVWDTSKYGFKDVVGLSRGAGAVLLDKRWGIYMNLLNGAILFDLTGLSTEELIKQLKLHYTRLSLDDRRVQPADRPEEEIESPDLPSAELEVKIQASRLSAILRVLSNIYMAGGLSSGQTLDVDIIANELLTIHQRHLAPRHN